MKSLFSKLSWAPAASLLLLLSGNATGQKRFELTDIAKTVGVGDPQLSPDGKSILVVVSRSNFATNRNDAEVVLVDVATGRQRVLVAGRPTVKQPRWSPTGDRVAFLARTGSGKDAHTQLFVQPLPTGEPVQLTTAVENVQLYSWSPDGKALAYSSADAPTNAAEVARGNDSFEVGNGSVTLTAPPTPDHLWLVSAAGSQPAQRLTNGPGGLPDDSSAPFAWAPNGRTLVCVLRPSAQTGDQETTVCTLDVATGTVRPLPGSPHRVDLPAFSPDGRWISYQTPREPPFFESLDFDVVPAAGGKPRHLGRALDRNLQRAVWSPDSKSLFVGGNDGASVSIWQQGLNGSSRKLKLGPVSPNGSYWVEMAVGRRNALAITANEPGRPAELYYLASPTSTPRRLTDFNHETAAMPLGRMEAVEWNSDNLRPNGILTYPPDFDATKKYPLVLLMHGGPSNASRLAFYGLGQAVAARGYVVFQPNYRGSDNLGYAFQRAIREDAGAGPGRDVLAGIAMLEKRGWVDSTRIALSGASYGGFMTTWLMGESRRWRCAVAAASVTDLLDSYNLSDNNVANAGHYGPSPWRSAENLARYRTQSPLSRAGRWRTPTLILHNVGDFRVPITNSYKLYHALQDNGVPVRFVAFPIAAHTPSDPVRLQEWNRLWVGWLDQYLQPEAATAAPGK
ncbi:S9 family peptidase [Hymenobacter sp. BT770]|uniref:alpha/beta hydrolase family protein n=1 Tax=Hymenobacter sp. BT770 TaxID=2886942 RepID=UPI001D10A867|nr:S9 family peptidase [Hymenobacter sp. BT770]MCC3154247.1 S9 family peptidase [Hymenobacter sp. BT770]MDO3416373.1 S9 family peptidase [Hymenobacter sp. BT770]